MRKKKPKSLRGGIIDSFFTMKTKVKLADGRVCPAKLVGQKGGDLFGGEIMKGKRKFFLGHSEFNLPKKDFPIHATEPTPFVDFPFLKKSKRRRKK